MGQLLGKFAHPSQVSHLLTGRRKRKLSVDTNSDFEGHHQNGIDSPKKKKLLTTTQYIYKALFKEQQNTDVSVMALGKVWNLHKVYLSQSPYFYTMFNGSWKESTENFIHIKMLDERITIDALDAVFGSLYSDEILIDSDSVVSILATGTLFHLDGIIDKCCEVMNENISEETVLPFYEAACQYGCINVKKETFKWLEINLLSLHSSKCVKMIRHISIDLMTDLVKSPNLYVIQTEYSLYNLLRTWIYARVNPNYPDRKKKFNHSSESALLARDKEFDRKQLQRVSPDINQTNTSSNTASATKTDNDPVLEYFHSRNDEKTPFLLTREGREYMKPFLALRTQYLINHNTDLQIILNDNIIPKEWVNNHVLYHWDHILRTDHVRDDDGPQNLDPEIFNKHSMRCGRILLEPGYQKWRWTGFNFGVDLIFIADSRVLSIRRHHRPEHERLLSFKTNRQLMIRASVTSLNSEKRQPVFTQTTDLLSLSLGKNAEATLMVMDSKLIHPLLISVNLLMIPPAPDFKEELLYNEESSLNISVPISEIGAGASGDYENNDADGAYSASRPITGNVTNSNTNEKVRRKSLSSFPCRQLVEGNSSQMPPAASGSQSSIDSSDSSSFVDPHASFL